MISLMETALALHAPNPAIIIRPSSPADLNSLMVCCWQNRRREVGRWLLDRAERNRHQRRGESLVVLAAGQTVIGYGQLTTWPRCAEISDLVIADGYRSQGYGTALIQHLTRYARTLHARCVEIGAAQSNPRAVALYQRLGFTPHRTVNMQLEPGQREAVTYMILNLPPRQTKSSDRKNRS